jgi:hypothetical protein
VLLEISNSTQKQKKCCVVVTKTQKITKTTDKPVFSSRLINLLPLNFLNNEKSQFSSIGNKKPFFKESGL